jgi:methionyl-tRNA formyltransferase
MNGDEGLGVSVIFLEEEMDAGPILRQAGFQYNGLSAAAWDKVMSMVGATLLLITIDLLKTGRHRAMPQDSAQATVNRLLTKEDGRIDFSRPAALVARLINGAVPWPGAYTVFRGKTLKLFEAKPADTPHTLRPGQVGELPGQGGGLTVGTGQGAIEVFEFQPEGKKRMSAADFRRGYSPDVLGA